MCVCVCVRACVSSNVFLSSIMQLTENRNGTQKARPWKRRDQQLALFRCCNQKIKRIDRLRRRAWFLQRVEAKRGERAIRGKGERVKGQESAHSPWACITDRATERRHVRADSVLIYAHTLI